MSDDRSRLSYIEADLANWEHTRDRRMQELIEAARSLGIAEGTVSTLRRLQPKFERHEDVIEHYVMLDKKRDTESPAA